MTNKTINDLNEQVSPAAGDFLALWVTGSAAMRKVTRANLVGATLTGGGAIATGGYTLTMPATGTAALLATVNTFTRGPTISPTNTSDHGININMPAGVATTARAIRVTLDSTLRANLQIDDTHAYFSIATYDDGAMEGPYLILGRNNNASTPAAGFINMTDKGGQGYRVWPDDSGVVRVHTADPTNANDTAGAVVGSQTSNVLYKDVKGSPVSDADALAHLIAAAEQVQRFTYKSGAYNNQEFSGLVLDGETMDRYGMDADAEHPAGKSLNLINVVGDLLLAVRNLTARLEAVEGA